MFTLRPARRRGHANHGWLDTWHTFSFANYFDPAHMQFRDLRVINDDTVAPDNGFGMHGHKDMEIITYVMSGALEHRDSMGNGSVLTPGMFQRMSAGTGVRHSEFNPSKTEPVHLYQIWIMPESEGITPSYEEKTYPADVADKRWHLVASRDGRDNAMRIHQDVDLYHTELAAGDALSFGLRPGRHAWLQVTHGSLQLGDLALTIGDGVAVSDESALDLKATTAAGGLLFDLN